MYLYLWCVYRYTFSLEENMQLFSDATEERRETFRLDARMVFNKFVTFPHHLPQISSGECVAFHVVMIGVLLPTLTVLVKPKYASFSHSCKHSFHSHAPPIVVTNPLARRALFRLPHPHPLVLPNGVATNFHAGLN